MTKKELNLLEFSAGSAAEPSATPAQIVRCKFRNANLGREFLDDVPNGLLRYTSPQALPALLTRRKSRPDSIPADLIQSSTRPYTLLGAIPLSQDFVFAWPAQPVRVLSGRILNVHPELP